MRPSMLFTTCSLRLLRGTIESVYKWTLVYACERIPTPISHMTATGALAFTIH